jgi:hypothetical protein
LQTRKLGIHIGKLARGAILATGMIAQGLVESSPLGCKLGDGTGQLGKTLL